ncbi:hypothetical protein FBU30_000104 [Linnemannia zychae]|nr:hypothetical protein FBU30_000104 [Linnemannia zychae]
MIHFVSTSALALLSALALISTTNAAVLSSNPTAITLWKIGSPAQIRWRLTSPTPKNHVATIYIVGGDYTAYKRLATLGTNVELGKHTLDIPKVPDVNCLDTCAIEFVVTDEDGNVKEDPNDFYSHSFTISSTGEAGPASAAVADKSSPVAAGSVQNAATPSGPVTLIQNAAKGTQPHATPSGSSASQLGSATAAVVLAAAASAIGMILL